MKKKLTFGHLFLLNQVIWALVVLSVIGIYGSYLFHLEQRAIRDRIEPIINREVERINSDIQNLEGNVQKLKSLVDLYDVIPQNQRVARFREFAATMMASHPTQFNAFFALGPNLAQKFFGKKAYIQVVHRDYSLIASSKYNDPATFIAEEFITPGFDKDPELLWWTMNEGHRGVNFSDFYFDKGFMERVMFTTGMGIYEEGRLEGVVGIDTLAADIANRFSQIQLGETGGLLIVDEYGRPILPLLSRDMDLIGYKHMRAFTRDEFVLMPKISQKIFNLQGLRIQDFSGSDEKTYVTLAKAIKGRPWHLVIFQEKVEAYSSLYLRMFVFILVALAVYLLITLMFWMTGNYVMAHDRRAMKELRESRDRAEAATRAKSLFLSTMSHEIRTPLNAMLGSTDLLVESSLSSEQRTYLRAIQDAGEVLLNVLNNVLDFSKIESGKMQLEIREFLLSDLVNELSTLLWGPLNRKSLKWVVNVPSDDRFVKGDSLRIKQILMNLLSNAAKFTEKGHIELTIQFLHSTEPGHERIYFEVKDTGVGIAKENLKKVFEEFSQEDSSVTRKFGGSGLGLSICRRIAQMMKSELHCESQQYLGSKFYFVLDLPTRPAGDWVLKHLEFFKEARRPDKNIDLNPAKKVLVVDDMEENHSLIKAYLRHIPDLQVDSAYSGRECLLKCEGSRYEMILMDVQMPEMSGLETIRRLRGLEAGAGLRRTPVIVISANSFSEDIEKSLEAGADEHCGKPIRKQTVRGLVEKYCFPAAAESV